MDTTRTTADTRVIDMTIGQLNEIIARQVAEAMDAYRRRGKEQARAQRTAKLVGVTGLAIALNVSRRTAGRIKSAGMVDEAIIPAGGKAFFVDTAKARELYAERAGRRVVFTD